MCWQSEDIIRLEKKWQYLFRRTRHCHKSSAEKHLIDSSTGEVPCAMRLCQQSLTSVAANARVTAQKPKRQVNKEKEGLVSSAEGACQLASLNKPEAFTDAQ